MNFKQEIVKQANKCVFGKCIIDQFNIKENEKVI